MKSIRAWLAAACMGLGAIGPAHAENESFLVQSATSLAVTNVSGNVQLTTGVPVAFVCNIGSTEAFVRFGASNAITATVSSPSSSLPAGLCLPYNSAGQTYLAAITSAGTTTLRVTQGAGNVGPAGIANGGTGGATSANQALEIAALGATTDAAFSGGATASIVAALKGIFNNSITAGTFGSPSATVLSFQGGASMTPIRQFPVPTALSEGAITPVTVASGQTLVLKASAGNLYGVYATNFNAVAGFLVVGNVTAAPADGAVTPIECVPIAASGTASINYNGAPPAAFATGMTAWLTSASNCSTKTTTSAIAGFIKGMVQ